MIQDTLPGTWVRGRGSKSPSFGFKTWPCPALPSRLQAEASPSYTCTSVTICYEQALQALHTVIPSPATSLRCKYHQSHFIDEQTGAQRVKVMTEMTQLNSGRARCKREGTDPKAHAFFHLFLNSKQLATCLFYE